MSLSARIDAGCEPNSASNETDRRPFAKTYVLTPFLIAARGHGPAADAALEDLLTALYEPVQRFALKRLHKFVDATEVAADTTQEALIRMAHTVRQCTAATDAQVMAWAHGVTRHTMIDMYRSPSTGLAARQLAGELKEFVAGQSFEEATGERLAGSPVFGTLIRVMMEAYNDAVESVGELLWWRLIMGLEWSEVGARYSVTEAAAKRRFQRAQLTLRREIIRRANDLPLAEREGVLALLRQFGYGDPTEAGEASTDSPECVHSPEPQPVTRAPERGGMAA